MVDSLSFKSMIMIIKSKRNILERLKNCKIDKSFIEKEAENILYAIKQHNIQKQNLKMTDEKFRKPFNI